MRYFGNRVNCTGGTADWVEEGFSEAGFEGGGGTSWGREGYKSSQDFFKQ